MRAFVLFAVAAVALAQPAPESGRRYPRLVIRNAMVVDGNGTPAAGPRDIVIERNRIAAVNAPDPMPRVAPGGIKGDAEIDAAGKYVLPGLINAHGHIHEERGGVAQPLEYQLKLWLASGITTVRDVGSDTRRALELRRLSAAGSIAAPRFFVYPVFGRLPDAAAGRARVRELKQMGADGVKVLHIYRDVMAAMSEEAHALGLRI